MHANTQRGALNLTPNRRMAFVQSIRTHTPTLPLSSWLESLYTELTLQDPSGSLPTLLGVREQEIVWEKIVAGSEWGQSLLKTGGAALLASEAWGLCVQWNVTFEQLGVLTRTQGGTPDVLVFLEWCAEYLAVCKAKNWIDTTSSLNLISEAIPKGVLSLPAEINLVGFEELTPQLETFIHHLKQAGTKVRSLSLVKDNSTVSVLPTEDPLQELRFAAHTARRWMSEDPNHLIGIVVPDLEQNRSQVARIFEEVLPKETMNVAAPIALSRYPLIEAALLVLSFLKEFPFEKFSRFLRSPFFGGALQERASRATLDVILRDWGFESFTLESLLLKLKYLQNKENTTSSRKPLGISDLFARLQKVQCLLPETRGKHSASTWSVLFKHLLDCMGWPGEQALTPVEAEIHAQFDEFLADYLCLGRVLGDHSYWEAITELTCLANKTPFLPTSSRGSVQILGMLEAVGIPFDKLWMTGLHREAWPLTPAPNPFIPIALQREKGLPRSSAARELTMAKRFTERLCQGAKDVIFSYPSMIEERATAISPLLAHLPVTNAKALGLLNVQSYLERVVQVNRFERRPNEPAPTVDPSEKIRGGAHLLKLQSNCPFRAFAEIRLRAEPLPILMVGLTPAERGEIIHKVLQIFWEGLADQTALKALSEETLVVHITTALNTVLENWKAKRPKILTPHYAKLEYQRIFQLIQHFITLEKERPYFKVIANEKNRVVDWEGLALAMRIDRIDQLENGDEVLIDYKTGETSVSGWFGERPRDPQLPLYCVTHEKTPAAAVLGILRPGEIKFQGLAKDETVIPDVRTLEQTKQWGSESSFEAQCETWGENLRSLAKDFKEGIANVDPLDGENTCRQCALKSLCRVNSYRGSLNPSAKLVELA